MYSPYSIPRSSFVFVVCVFQEMAPAYNQYELMRLIEIILQARRGEIPQSVMNQAMIASPLNKGHLWVNVCGHIENSLFKAWESQLHYRALVKGESMWCAPSEKNHPKHIIIDSFMKNNQDDRLLWSWRSPEEQAKAWAAGHKGLMDNYKGPFGPFLTFADDKALKAATGRARAEAAKAKEGRVVSLTPDELARLEMRVVVPALAPPIVIGVDSLLVRPSNLLGAVEASGPDPVLGAGASSRGPISSGASSFVSASISRGLGSSPRVLGIPRSLGHTPPSLAPISPICALPVRPDFTQEDPDEEPTQPAQQYSAPPVNPFRMSPFDGPCSSRDSDGFLSGIGGVFSSLPMMFGFGMSSSSSVSSSSSSSSHASFNVEGGGGKGRKRMLNGAFKD